MTVFAGLDWASHTHAVCIIDATGAVRDRFEVTHDAPGLRELLARLRRCACGAGAIAHRHRASLGLDSRCPARGRLHRSCRFTPTWSRPAARATAATAPRAMPATLTCWPTCCVPMATAGRRSQPQSDAIRALRALVRGRDDLVATRVQLGNQLHSTLETFWPGAACDLRRHHLADRAWRSCAATHAGQRRSPEREAHWLRFPRPAPLQRPTQPSRNCWRVCAQRPPATPSKLETDTKRTS